MSVYLDVPFDSTKDKLETEINSGIPILDKQEDYSVSVIKTQIPLHGMPVFIAELDLTDPNWLNTVYTCFIAKYDSGTGDWDAYPKINLTIDPETSDPKPTDRTRQPTNRYAWMYSFNSVAAMVDRAIQAMNGNVIGNVPEIRSHAFFNDSEQKLNIGVYPSSQFTGVDSPFIYYFSNNCRFLFQGLQLRESKAYPEYFYIVFTQKCTNIYMKSNNIWAQQVIQDPANEPNPWGNDDIDNTTVGILLECNWQNFSFSPVKSIIIVTNMQIASEATIAFDNIPKYTKTQMVLYSYNDQGQYIGTLTDIYQQTASSFTLNVIADFTVDISSLSDVQGYLTYNSSVIKDSRVVEIFGQGPLNTLSFSIQWVDVFGYIRSVETQSRQENAVLKLAFIKK